ADLFLRPFARDSRHCHSLALYVNQAVRPTGWPGGFTAARPISLAAKTVARVAPLVHRQRHVTAHDHELRAAIPRPRRLIAARIDRVLLTVGHLVQPGNVDPLPGEILLDRGGPAFTQRLVVLIRSAFVTGTGDSNSHRGVGVQNRHLAVEDG